MNCLKVGYLKVEPTVKVFLLENKEPSSQVWWVFVSF